MKTHVKQLTDLHTCREGIAFADTQPDMASTWANCPRGDWLLWLLGKKATEADRKNIVLVACGCARLVLPVFENRHPDDNRVRACIETTEACLSGEATIADVRKARSAAVAAAYADAYAAADAAAVAYAAAYAADAAYDADAAAYAYAAAYADAYADADARKRVQAECANIVRKYFPNPPVLDAAQEEAP